MLTDKLKLNDDKTEFMLIGTKQQLSKVNIDCLTVGSIDVAPVTVARNLGTWFDSNLNLQEQIHKTCKSGFSHLYNIRAIKAFKKGVLYHGEDCNRGPENDPPILAPAFLLVNR